MKKVIKGISLVLTMGIILVLGACSNNTGENNSDKSIYEQGLTLIPFMEEMAESESYLTLHSGGLDLQEVVSRVSNGDYTEPKAVYQIKFSDNVIEDENINRLSNTLKEFVTSKLQLTVTTQINAAGGQNMMVAGTICTAEKFFVNNNLTEDITYLYTYEDAVPVMVTFIVGEDGAVLASGRFIFYEDFKTDTAESIEQFFTEIGVGVKEIALYEN